MTNSLHIDVTCGNRACRKRFGYWTDPANPGPGKCPRCGSVPMAAEDLRLLREARAQMLRTNELLTQGGFDDHQDVVRFKKWFEDKATAPGFAFSVQDRDRYEVAKTFVAEGLHR
jgi:hypothetical protein